MKRVWAFIIILIMGSVIKVQAESMLELNDSIIEFDNITNYNLQGFTTINNYLFMVLDEYEDTKSIIKVYNLNDGKLIKSYEYGSLGHANDVTYNSKNNLIYVLQSGGFNKVFIFDGDSFEYKETISISLPLRSITYIDDLDKYAGRTVATGFMFNNDFSLSSKIPFIVGMNFSNKIGRQGWAYYNGYIYYANWSWKRFGGDGSNMIFIYDLNGNKIDSLRTKVNIGEIEDIAFYNNKMILGFNSYDNKIKFYMEDIPEVKILEVSQDVDEEAVDNTNMEDNENNNNVIYILISLLFFIIVIGIGIFSIIHKKSV